jgi:geranylgeranyl diphosphate synthase type I
VGEVSILLTIEHEMKRIAELIDVYIQKILTGEPSYLYDASSYLLRAGGKRLRPLVLLKFYSMYGSDESSVLPAAAAVELVHNFTLIHDDIMDHDELRRGVPTTHKKFGEPMAILAGDVLFAKVFWLISESPSFHGDFDRIKRAVAEVANSLVTVCEGQALDLNPPRLEDFTEDYYFKMIEKKTSALFEASAALGCLAGRGPEEDISNARLYARHLGLAFQLVDDVLGIAGDPSITGKPVGGDVREGKRTLPLILALRLADRRRSDLLLSVWGVRDAPQHLVEEAINYIRDTGVEVKVRELAGEHLKNALQALNRLPKGEGNDSLAELAHYLTLRRM